jgi:hypothetical protein
MTNGDGGPQLIGEVMRALAAEYQWPDYGAKQVTTVAVEPAAVAGLLGKYLMRVGPGVRAEVRKDGDKLMLKSSEFPAQELLAESDTSFVTSTLGWRVTFARDASGKATGITVLLDSGPQLQGSRVP